MTKSDFTRRLLTLQHHRQAKSNKKAEAELNDYERSKCSRSKAIRKQHKEA